MFGKLIIPAVMAVFLIKLRRFIVNYNISSKNDSRQDSLKIHEFSVFWQRAQDVIRMHAINDSGVIGDTHWLLL